ncbi:MAG TPA: PH domain-containing protein [Mycobacteriales bacterium]|nr:PH domain-containing protein [Mycobacteriales bacterium]
MRLRWLARAEYVGVGAWLGLMPSLAAGGLFEPAWPYVAVPLAGLGAWRGATVRVRETPEGLVVRNVLRTFRVPWSDIEDVRWDGSFTVPRGFVAPGLRVPWRDRPISVLALACWGRPARADAATARGWLGRRR